MNNSQNLNSDTTSYLNCFYKILENMIKGMVSAKLVDSISHNFIVQMIPHYEGAIRMSQNLLHHIITLQEGGENYE